MYVTSNACLHDIQNIPPTYVNPDVPGFFGCLHTFFVVNFISLDIKKQNPSKNRLMARDSANVIWFVGTCASYGHIYKYTDSFIHYGRLFRAPSKWLGAIHLWRPHENWVFDSPPPCPHTSTWAWPLLPLWTSTCRPKKWPLFLFGKGLKSTLSDQGTEGPEPWLGALRSRLFLKLHFTKLVMLCFSIT